MSSWVSASAERQRARDFGSGGADGDSQRGLPSIWSAVGGEILVGYLDERHARDVEAFALDKVQQRGDRAGKISVSTSGSGLCS
jgi:hypothetical protein